MSRFLLRRAITAACVVVLSSSASAQVPGQSDQTVGHAVTGRSMPTMMAPTMMAPTLLAAALAIPTTTAPTVDPEVSLRPVNDVASVVRRRESFGRPAVLMITGGALLLTGILVGGDAAPILIIAGAGIGGYGLYLHLQTPNARMGR